VVVVVPTDNPALGSVSYQHTTTYHWPQMDKNLTDADGNELTEGFTETNGPPPTFKKAVELKDQQCLEDDNFAADEDDCFGNPIGCADGFSFALFYFPMYKDTQMQLLDENNNFTREYIASSGGELGQKGFSIYREGAYMGAVVSTGELTWETKVFGHVPKSYTWANLAIRWVMPFNISADELNQKARNPSFDTGELGGLEFFINLEKVGQDIHGEECESCTEDDICADPFIPPKMILGCQMTTKDKTKRLHAPGRFDELAFWKWRLNDTQKPYFLGGHKTVFEDISAADIVALMSHTDLTDVAQLSTVTGLLKGIMGAEEEPDETSNENEPSATESTGSAGGSEGSGGSGTDGNATAETDGENSGTSSVSAEDAKLTKELTGLLKVTEKMTETGKLKSEIIPQEFNARLEGATTVLELVSDKGKYPPHWKSLNKYPNESAAHGQLQNVVNFAQYIVERRSEMAPFAEAEDGEFETGMAGSNFGLQVFKVPAATYEKKGDHTGKERTRDDELENKYWAFPDWKTETWKNAIRGFGNHPDTFDPTEKIQIPSEVFSGDCKKHPVSFTGIILDTFPDPGRKNPTFMPANHVELDSRIIVMTVTANKQGDIEGNDATDRDFNTRCQPDETLLRGTPIKIELGVKSYRHNYGRKLMSYFDTLDSSQVRKRHCAIWNPDISTNGAWDTEGVKTVFVNDGTAECSSTRFGTFAIIAEIEDQPYAPEDELWLLVTKSVGYGLSIICLIAFIIIVLLKKYLWEMFHVIGLNTAVALLLAHIFMLASESEAIRGDRDLCCLVGSCMSFFYTATVSLMAMDTFALFRAIIAGVIGGRTKAYLAAGWGIPMITLGYNIFENLELMGLDPRCMMGWLANPKWYFFVPFLAISGSSLLIIMVVVMNIRTPAMRKESFVEEMSSLAIGIFFFMFLVSLTWGMAPLAYIRFPGLELPDFYPAFQVLNSFSGIFFFCCLGVGSKRFRIALMNQQEARRLELIKQARGFDDTAPILDDDVNSQGSRKSLRSSQTDNQEEIVDNGFDQEVDKDKKSIRDSDDSDDPSYA